MFGKGKVSSLMGEVGKGITAFKKGVTDGSAEIEAAKAEAAKDVTPDGEKPGSKPSDKDKVVNGLNRAGRDDGFQLV